MLSVLLPQFCCEPKSILKLVYLKTDKVPEASTPDFLLALLSTKVPGRSEGTKVLELTRGLILPIIFSKQCDLQSNAQSSVCIKKM